MTGGGTGTHWIDGQTGLFTELQPGSFLFLDSCYAPIELLVLSLTPFQPSLFVAAGVISANPGLIESSSMQGSKALATDFRQAGTDAWRATRGNFSLFSGDEHGAIEFTAGPPPPVLGTVIELPHASHCGSHFVNLVYNRYLVVRGDTIIDEWSIAARGYCLRG